MVLSAALGIQQPSGKPHGALGLFRPSSSATSGIGWSQAVHLSRSTTIDWFILIISGAAFAWSLLSEPEYGAG